MLQHLAMFFSHYVVFLIPFDSSPASLPFLLPRLRNPRPKIHALSDVWKHVVIVLYIIIMIVLSLLAFSLWSHVFSFLIDKYIRVSHCPSLSVRRMRGRSQREEKGEKPREKRRNTVSQFVAFIFSFSLHFQHPPFFCSGKTARWKRTNWSYVLSDVWRCETECEVRIRW